MIKFDEELHIESKWRANFYNAEDVAENGEFANFDCTEWFHPVKSLTLREKAEMAEAIAKEKGFDTFEIEMVKHEELTVRFHVGVEEYE